MIIDDAKGVLKELRAAISEDTRVKSKEDLKPGDIIEMEMDANDGLILNDGYDTRRKFVVIIGRNTKGDLYGAFLINSEIDFSKQNPEMMPYQYPMLQKDYPEILDYDSWLDCTDLFDLKRRKIIARKAMVRCRLTDNDHEKVLQLVRNSELIEEHDKKIFGLLQ